MTGTWGFLGLPGIRELVVIAVVALLLYGRSGLPHGRYLRLLQPWSSNPRRPAPRSRPQSGGRLREDRLYWFLAVVAAAAAAAVAAWVVTRLLIVAAPGASH